VPQNKECHLALPNWESNKHDLVKIDNLSQTAQK
jgi:hypothetical protein